MLSATPKGNRRSTRVGRHRDSGGGGSRPSSRGASVEASWRPSDKAARKWIQIMRPPAPDARFEIPTWVAIDDLTPEEKVKSGLAEKKDETTPAANAETGDTIMVAEGTNTEEKAVPIKETENTEMADAERPGDPTVEQQSVEQAVAPTQNVDTPMKAVDSTPDGSNQVSTEQSDQVEDTANTSVTGNDAKSDADRSANEPKANKTEVNNPSVASTGTKETEAAVDADVEMAVEEPTRESKPETHEESAPAPAARPAALSPLQMSRETSTSEGIPSDVAKAFESVEGLEELRPHDPVADALVDAAPPSRPVSEPSAILLMKGPAAPLVGDSVMSPVPAVAVPSKGPSSSAGPSTTSSPEESSSFVHSGSETAPFQTPQKEGTSNGETEPPSTDRGQPPLKKPRLE